MKKRAAAQEQTRRRIVEAAIDLHGTIGPARTTVSAIAARAGVQRHTYYRHFPEERDLGLACSGLYQERNPIPDPAPWKDIADPEERLRTGVDALYLYFAANEPMLANVMRDAEFDPVTREIVELRIGSEIDEIKQVLTRGAAKNARALINVAIQFQTWRSLVRESGLSHSAAVETMVGAVAGASRIGKKEGPPERAFGSKSARATPF